jgi:DNA-binding GntR family transcriptional regulator
MIPGHENKSYRVVKTNLNSQVYDILKEMIADQRFNPESYINVEQLTHELGVSRTPIWEAIRRLEQEGIVVHTPHKGVKVRELTREMALELYMVREALECLAARLGASQATPAIIEKMETCLGRQELSVEREDPVAYSHADHEFHLLICEASGNKLLKEVLEGLRYKAFPLAFRLMPHLGEFLDFHREILGAFRLRDSHAAEETMGRHNRRMMEIVQTIPWGIEEEPKLYGES